MSYYTHQILIISFIFWSFFAVSQNAYSSEQQELYGLSMHGDAKYSPKDTHLDYADPDAPKGGVLKLAAPNDSYDTLNPYTIKGTAAAGLALVYDRLMQRVWDEPFTMYPLIAERVEVPEDRSSITFHLNPKAIFHDRSKITSADVEYSFTLLKEFGRPNMRRVYGLVDQVQIISPSSIKFTLGKGHDRETVMILAMMPVLSKAWWSQREFDQTLTEIPVLNGPYKIKSSDIGRQIIYERVPDYWAKDLLVNKGHFNFDEVIYDYYRDATISLEAFKKGDLNFNRESDVTKWNTAFSDVDPEKIIKWEAPHSRPERAHGFIFNLRRAQFQNVDVRKALKLAFDYDWVGQNLFHGKYKPVDSFFPNSILAAPEEISMEEQKILDFWSGDVFINDLPEAKTIRERLKLSVELLEKAGYVIQNGKRIHKENGRTLDFELLISTNQEKKIALAYKKNLKRLGIDMQIRLMDSAAFQDRRKTYDYDAFSYFWLNSLSPGSEQSIYWSCEAAEQEGRFNYAGICNAALDEFSLKIADAQTYDELKLYAHLIDRVLKSEHIMVPLFYKDSDYIAFSKDLGHPDITPTYGIVIETWYTNQP
ncbi:MAG: extracellular solute-binding protein [Alphaproteobacteria bacterium]|nr:extracellular solute-binding protein [Alphaproteobacteria bacterium]